MKHDGCTSLTITLTISEWRKVVTILHKHALGLERERHAYYTEEANRLRGQIEEALFASGRK